MTKWEFMRRLEELLFDISPAEREEALQYYNDYINDAGIGNESQAIASLGTPEQVAAIVKEGLEGNTSGMFTESGYQGSHQQSDSVVTKYEQPQQNQSQAEDAPAAEKKNKMSTGTIILIVILCIFASPILLSVASAILGVLISVATVVFFAFFVVALLAIVLFITALALIIAGISTLITTPFLGIGLIGSGCIVGCLAILSLLLTVAMFGKVLPALFRGIASLFQKIFYRKRGAAA